jgi:hypothetical protein
MLVVSGVVLSVARTAVWATHRAQVVHDGSCVVAGPHLLERNIDGYRRTYLRTEILLVRAPLQMLSGQAALTRW